MLVFDDGPRRVHALKLGSLGTNCYIVETPARAFVIDPVADPATIAAYLEAHRVKPAFAVATHAHFDHIGAAAGLIGRGIVETICIHGADDRELERCRTYSVLIGKRPMELPARERIVWLGPTVSGQLAEAGFGLQHLPSHTPGSCILFSEDRKLLFSGDIILNNLVRDVRPAVGESRDGMLAAFDFIEASFSPSALVFPGHGKLTLLETELRFNPSIWRLRNGTQ